MLPVAPRPGLAGAAVRGHHTARWSPTAPGDAPRGYRDAGSVTLAATARVTAEMPATAGKRYLADFLRPGALPGPALEGIIEQIKGLDMDDVRRQIAEQQAAAEG